MKSLYRDGSWFNIKLDEKFKTIFMNLNQKELKDKFGKSIFFQENLSKYSWFNFRWASKNFI